MNEPLRSLIKKSDERCGMLHLSRRLEPKFRFWGGRAHPNAERSAGGLQKAKRRWVGTCANAVGLFFGCSTSHCTYFEMSRMVVT